MVWCEMQIQKPVLFGEDGRNAARGEYRARRVRSLLWKLESEGVGGGVSYGHEPQRNEYDTDDV
jgi:predicted NBD/HSP70 family sugar kinase